jgi:hypothetical protein
MDKDCFVSNIIKSLSLSGLLAYRRRVGLCYLLFHTPHQTFHLNFLLLT